MNLSESYLNLNSSNKRPFYIEHKDRDIRIKSATVAINAILPLDLYPAHKRELLSVCIWKITEADGKYKVRYWSEGSISSNVKLQHEHVYERKTLISRLLDGEPVESVICDAVACMVTKTEHERLTRSKQIGWARYKDAGVRVFDAKKERWR